MNPKRQRGSSIGAQQDTPEMVVSLLRINALFSDNSTEALVGSRRSNNIVVVRRSSGEQGEAVLMKSPPGNKRLS
jgi:hypothetical protein